MRPCDLYHSVSASLKASNISSASDGSSILIGKSDCFILTGFHFAGTFSTSITGFCFQAILSFLPGRLGRSSRMSSLSPTHFKFNNIRLIAIHKNLNCPCVMTDSVSVTTLTKTLKHVHLLVAFDSQSWPISHEMKTVDPCQCFAHTIWIQPIVIVCPFQVVKVSYPQFFFTSRR